MSLPERTGFKQKRQTTHNASILAGHSKRRATNLQPHVPGHHQCRECLWDTEREGETRDSRRGMGQARYHKQRPTMEKKAHARALKTMTDTRSHAA